MAADSSVIGLEKLESLFDGEWVLIEDLVTEGDEVLAGRVTAHSPSVKDVYAAAAARSLRDAAVFFMGAPRIEGEIVLWSVS